MPTPRMAHEVHGARAIMKPNTSPLPAALLLVATLGTPACLANPAGPGDGVAGRDANLDSGASYTLWIHGLDPNNTRTPGDYTDWSYWGDPSLAAGSNPKAVNWDGTNRIAENNETIRNALDCFCTGSNTCVVAAHSAGDPQIGYALSLFGDGERPVTDATPDGTGACTGTGDTQTGWNVTAVYVAGGAAGGSELADLDLLDLYAPLVQDLKTDTARALYDHDATAGTTFSMYAGAAGAVWGAVFPGRDDEVVAYHSTGGMSDVGSFCNPGDVISCLGPTLELGDAPSGDTPKWAGHEVAYRDDAEALDHFGNGVWGGIIGPMRSDVAAQAGP